ncbi:MAG: hypothetical protein MW690_000815 [Methanophagales archaeon]|nr:hypothetical protein [Methanophagales archaeon]
MSPNRGGSSGFAYPSLSDGLQTFGLYKRWLKSSARIAEHVANAKACLLHTNTLRPSKKPNGIMLKRASHPFTFEPISPICDAKSATKLAPSATKE